MSNRLTYEDFIWEAELNGLSTNKESLIALAPANDPFACNGGDHRAWATWFARWFNDLGLNHGSNTLHLRGIHYLLASLSQKANPIAMPGSVDQGYAETLEWIVPQRGRKRKGETTGDRRWNGYGNDDYSWKRLQAAAKWARYWGLVDIDLIDDQRSPDPIVTLTSGERIIDVAVLEHTYLSEVRELQEAAVDVFLPKLLELPQPSTSSAPKRDAHVAHLEIWVEKSTLNGILVPLCRQYGITLVPCLGEVTLTAVAALMRRAGDRPVRIWHLSDFDPAGKSMTQAFARKVEYQARVLEDQGNYVPHIQIERLALTEQQVIDWDLPRIPIKASESRKEVFEGIHGEGGCELDALVAIRPGQLETLVREAVEPFVDCNEEARDELEDSWYNYQEEVKVEVAKAIEPYTETLEALHKQREEMDAAFMAKIQPLIDAYKAQSSDINNRYLSVWAEAKEAADAAIPEPPELDDPDVPELETPLMDSALSYCEQLVRYKDYKGGAS